MTIYYAAHRRPWQNGGTGFCAPRIGRDFHVRATMRRAAPRGRLSLPVYACPETRVGVFVAQDPEGAMQQTAERPSRRESFNVRLSPDERQRVEQVAAREERTTGDVIRRLIRTLPADEATS